MKSALLRYNLIPPGIRLKNEKWHLLKIDENINYKEYLLNYSSQILDKVNLNKNTDNMNWDVLISKPVINYLLAKHPSLKFADCSDMCDLTTITHIQALGISEKFWLGNSTAGASHFFKNEARNRTISEVLERTIICDLKISLDEVWGYSVAPTIDICKYNAIEECIERWLTYQAWIQDKSHVLIEIPINLILEKEALKSIIFEWQNYNHTINIYYIKNPLNIPAILIKISVQINDIIYIFFCNGVSKSFFKSIEKGLLESIQYIPGKEPPTWLVDLYKNPTSFGRIGEWQLDNKKYAIDRNHIDCNILYTTIEEEEYHHKLDITFNGINGKSNIYHLKDCTNIFFGTASIPGLPNWNNCKGIPIS